MENALQKAWHNEFGAVRVVMLNGTVYFVAIDVAKALLYKDTDKTIRNRVDAADKIVFDPDKYRDFKSPCGGVKIAKGAILINESGLWALVIHSKLPKAREFQHCLTSEVIPEIIRTGRYIPDDNPAFNPPKENFTKREKVEILMKLLNLPNLPFHLRNQMVRHVDLIISDEFDELLKNCAAEIEG